MFPKSITQAITARSIQTPAGRIQFANALVNAGRSETPKPTVRATATKAPEQRAPSTKIDIAIATGAALNNPGYKPTATITTNDPAVIKAVQDFMNPFNGVNISEPGARGPRTKAPSDTRVVAGPQTGSIKAPGYVPTYTITTTNNDVIDLIKELTGKPKAKLPAAGISVPGAEPKTPVAHAIEDPAPMTELGKIIAICEPITRPVESLVFKVAEKEVARAVLELLRKQDGDTPSWQRPRDTQIEKFEELDPASGYVTTGYLITTTNSEVIDLIIKPVSPPVTPSVESEVFKVTDKRVVGVILDFLRKADGETPDWHRPRDTNIEKLEEFDPVSGKETISFLVTTANSEVINLIKQMTELKQYVKHS